MPGAPHTLLLVDDHAIVRQGLAALLARDDAWRVAAEAGTYEEALAAALANPPPEGVLLDLSLRDRNGLDWIREARRKGYAGKILVLSMHDETLYAAKAIDAGAQGYVMKDQAEDILLSALSDVFAGKIHLSPAAAALLEADGGESEAAGRPATGIGALTAREREILYAIGGRLTTREIAEKFGLSGRTVDVHRVNIRRKLGCTSFAELLAKAMQFKQSEDGSPPGP
jgi:DNA-binding NarL/FixJ family response regulator